MISQHYADSMLYPRDHECDDPEKWVAVLEALADCILWDRDFEMTGSTARWMTANASFVGVEPGFFGPGGKPRAKPGAKKRLRAMLWEFCSKSEPE